MINFCHIAPTAYLDAFTKYNGSHLILAHLVETDVQYREFYRNLDDGKTKILDNSAFEMYKQGRPMYPSEKLIEMGKAVKADVIVMSDYPGQSGDLTINAAMKMSPELKAEGFRTFFVPQSPIGDLKNYLQVFNWALENEDLVDMIGVSILGAPNAFGVEKDNRLQRYLSRYKLMGILRDEGLLRKLQRSRNPQKLHFLGMVDGPNEIELVKEFHGYIYSWDSSAAVWAGLHNIEFDNSPTGLVNGKFEKEVEFDFVLPLDADAKFNRAVWAVKRNIDTINKMCGTYPQPWANN